MSKITGEGFKAEIGTVIQTSLGPKIVQPHPSPFPPQPLREVIERALSENTGADLWPTHHRNKVIDAMATALTPLLAHDKRSDGERSDKERLDWLEEHACQHWGKETDDEVANVEVTICAPVGVAELPKPLRSAIDAVM